MLSFIGLGYCVFVSCLSLTIIVNLFFQYGSITILRFNIINDEKYNKVMEILYFTHLFLL